MKVVTGGGVVLALALTGLTWFLEQVRDEGRKECEAVMTANVEDQKQRSLQALNKAQEIIEAYRKDTVEAEARLKEVENDAEKLRGMCSIPADLVRQLPGHVPSH